MADMMFISGTAAARKLPDGEAESSPAVWSMAEARALHRTVLSKLSFRAWARSGVFLGKKTTGKLDRIVTPQSRVSP